ncbi:MAG TPA: DUF5916 domain-containing protein [Kofleriaceae bacterium]|nr:DUF5916 domain-containing protein [Kofleriaceae bacterium]
MIVHGYKTWHLGCVGALIGLLVAFPTVTRADSSEPAEASESIVFVGLLPLTAKSSASDLSRLAAAQGLRTAAEQGLQAAAHMEVLGHRDLDKLLGAHYLVDWFKCGGEVSCIRQVVLPVSQKGHKTAVTGEYYVEGDIDHFRIVSFTIPDGKIINELVFTLAVSDSSNPAKWQEAFAGRLAQRRGVLKVTTNVEDATCMLDGSPCSFDGDSHTIYTTPGEHIVELTKAKYLPERITVNVRPGSEQSLPIPLRHPAPRDEPAGNAPGATGAGRLPRVTPTLAAVRTDAPVEIDGRLDEPAWHAAWIETNFTQSFPKEGKDPTQRTVLRVLYDDDAIYFGVHCLDENPDKIVSRLTRRDRDSNSDKIAVDISSKNDQVSSYHFEVNAAGVQMDGLRFNDTELSTDWDGLWYAAVSRGSTGWDVEIAIPLSTLRYDGDVSSFGFQVRRYLARRGETDEWAYIPSTAQGEVSRYGTLDGITGLQPKRLFQIRPYDVHKYTYRTGQGLFDGGTLGGNIGADMKVGLTSALTLDATINPDFGTVEVDQVVLNLTTVETYLPEKRPFFLEGSDLFATPFTLFYSRRVGAAPPYPTLVGDSQLLEPLPDSHIWGALKLTGLIADGTSIAVFDGITSRDDATIARTAGGPTEDLLIDPLTNFGVVRLRKDFGSGSSIGLMATSVNRLEPKGAAAPMAGDLCPVPYSTAFTSLVAPQPRDGRCTNDAYTAGIDTTLRSSNGRWGASAQIVGSLIDNGPTRLIPDGTEIGSGATGWGVRSEAGRYGGENWLYKIGYSNSSPRLQINDAGYEDKANFQEAYASVTLRTTKPSTHFLSKSVTGFVSHRRDWKLRDNLGFSPYVTADLQFNNFWSLAMELDPWWPTWVENRETQDGARTERSPGTYASAAITTDPKKRFQVTYSTAALKAYRDMLSLHNSATLSFKPTSTLQLELIPTFSWVTNNPRWIDTEINADDSRTYFFSHLDSKTLDLTLRGTYTFTRTLSLQGYLQGFMASGHFSDAISSTASGPEPLLTLDSFVDTSLPAGINPDFRYGTINFSLTARWEYLPRSTLWVVFTHSQDQEYYDPSEGAGRLRIQPFVGGPTTDVFFVELNYLWH